ncbi:hypothetical protein BB560_007233 [Smittium megazygosporum]|uniref:Fructose-1,6-bisphosphatase n=1 Tax=Smittium megazygosporum TaxID=133381 RepID=A0A2T9XXT3_9FUNG|nr:hypothetical protein BB560_007233 [Smittium megazygosporum]
MSELENTEGDDIMTLTRYVLELQRHFPSATGEMTILINSIQIACKYIESCVRRASLNNLIGTSGEINVQGENQKKLDLISNDVFINTLRASGRVASMVSEEVEKVIIVEGKDRGKYCLAFDPLDGSDNIDGGINVGTIFSIFRDDPVDGKPESSFLVSGRKLVAAGYCMYGSSCNLVVSMGNNRVDGFTLDSSFGEFILTHPKIKVPNRGKIYSTNEGNAMYWDEATRKYIDSVKFPDPSSGKKPYSARYIGSMVGDVHRTLLYGGIFAYPGDSKTEKGKLRTLYEAFPMAFLLEQAGGKATTGLKPVLDVIPSHIHDRCPIFLGSADDVSEAEEFFKTNSHCLTPEFC